MPLTPNTPTCEIVTIGSELLLGQIMDTNTSYLAQELAQQAFDTFLNKFGPQHPSTKISKKILDSI